MRMRPYGRCRSAGTPAPVAATIQPSVHALASTIETVVYPIPAPIEPAVNARAPAIEAPIDAIALAVEALCCPVAALIGGAVRPAIQTIVDIVTALVQPVFDPVPAPIHAILDAVATAIEALLDPVAATVGNIGRVRVLRPSLARDEPQSRSQCDPSLVHVALPFIVRCKTTTNNARRRGTLTTRARHLAYVRRRRLYFSQGCRRELWFLAPLWQFDPNGFPKRGAMNQILIIDDDSSLSEMLEEYLEAEGLEVATVATGTEGLRAARRGEHDLIVLDVMLPGLSGFEVLRQLRDDGSRTPVLMLTARGDDVDRIVGLEMGADDYLAKPFNPRELLARVKAILRRTHEQDAEAPTELNVGTLRADLTRREAYLRGEALKLTNAEFVVLSTLMRSSGEIVSREALTRAALGRQLLPDDRSLDTHISNLRRKLASGNGGEPQIRSIRGSGYVLVPPDEAR